MEELAKRLEDSDPAEAYYWYRLSVKRLNPADVGASRVDMEKWSIGSSNKFFRERSPPPRTT